MKHLILFSLLFPLTVSGFSRAPDVCNSYAFIEPTAREDGSSLGVSEIAYYTVYINQKKANYPKIPVGTNSWTWAGSTCGNCVQAITTDTNGLDSKFSECL